MPQYVLAIDQGTTGSTAMILKLEASASLRVIGQCTVNFQQYYPTPGWVEHDLGEIWHSVCDAIQKSLKIAAEEDSAFKPSNVVCIGITNQRETLCVFDRQSGKPLRKAIVWQCRRSTEICKRLKSKGLEVSIRSKTGLLLDPYFSGTKLAWILENEAELAAKIQNGVACIGTMDSFLLSRLTAGESFATEPSNASRTLLYDLHKGEFTSELLEISGLKSDKSLPELRDSAAVFGKTKGLGFLPDHIPITGMLGDQQSALAGQACFDAGEAKCTYGTGAFLLTNIGEGFREPPPGLLSTVAWQVNGKRTYALEGSCFIAGAAMQFLRDQFGFMAHAHDSEALAKTIQAAPEVYFVPAMAGLGAPYWDPHARGAFLGLTRGTSRAQMVRAGLEGMAFQVRDLCMEMSKALGKPMVQLNVDGGAAANNVLMQIQADYLGTIVDRPVNVETTVFGAAMIACLGHGIYKSFDELRGVRFTEKKFEPTKDPDKAKQIETQINGWHRAIKAVQHFAVGDS